jgi:CBS domain-containing protein
MRAGGIDSGVPGIPSEVRGIREFMEVELDERLLVEDAMTPVAYRVFPETPMGEVLDLMVQAGVDGDSRGGWAV